ncbi:hypothetical protein J6590_056822 [Homalodisca vitripennis]|nr:hypothetical protein J6590_056822 [Homalodisca vitripennis]
MKEKENLQLRRRTCKDRGLTEVERVAMMGAQVKLQIASVMFRASIMSLARDLAELHCANGMYHFSPRQTYRVAFVTLASCNFLR